MTRQFDPDEEPEDEEEPLPGRIRTTGPGPLLGFALVGLVIGRLVKPVSIELSGEAPLVGWVPVLALWFVAAILAGVAWLTYRSLHRRHERIEPYRAVNRLVLAKACALAGAMVAGGYFGYALGWLGDTDSPLGQDRFVRSLVGGFAGVATVSFSLLLERACRVSGDGDRDLG